MQKKRESKFTPIEKKWIMYDVGNSAFTLLVSVLIPLMVADLCTELKMTESQYTSFWAAVTSAVTLVVAVVSPIVGTLADTGGMKKPLFFASALIGIVGCVLLGMPLPLAGFVVVFVVTRMAYNVSLVFYDSMLTDVTDMERVDKISSNGYAWGYIGSCIPFIISIALYALGLFGLLDLTAAYIMIFALNGAWWLAFTLPLTKAYKQTHFIPRRPHAVRDSLKRLVSVFKDDTPNKKGILLFLVAFFLYIDGVYTIIDLATTYGKAVLGQACIDPATGEPDSLLLNIQLVLALLATQIIAFPCAIISGNLAKKFDNGKLIMVFIGGYLGIAIFAIWLTEVWQFWFLAVCVGLLQGGVQALSRSYFAKIIPVHKSGEFFGIMDIFGKGAAFIGTMLVSIVTAATGNSALGVIPISCLIGLGLAVFVVAYIEIKRYESVHGRATIAAQPEGEETSGAAAPTEDGLKD